MFSGLYPAQDSFNGFLAVKCHAVGKFELGDRKYIGKKLFTVEALIIKHIMCLLNMGVGSNAG